jgi:hypothetical protein
MLLLRRMGRERQARLPIEEASITMRHLYDEFACFCTPDLLQNSLDIVQARLAERRAKGKPDVELLPLPTGPGNLQRLKRLFRYDNLRRYYPGTSGADGGIPRAHPAQLARNPKWFEEEVAALGVELAKTPHYVYSSRDKGCGPRTWRARRRRR